MADDDGGVVHLTIVGDAIDAAEEGPPAASDERRPPADAGGPGDPQAAAGGGLPDGCPVTPLGMEGDTFHYLDAIGQLFSIKGRDHSRLGIQQLFAKCTEYLKHAWPRTNADGDVKGWRPEEASMDLMRACAFKGIWSAFERVRGAGAWAGENGELILHCGDTIWQGDGPATGFTAGTFHSMAEIGRYVYPKGGNIPRPAMEPQAADGGPAAELREIFAEWNWRRDLDSLLLLGWVGAGVLGGALDWRPVLWITGGSGTGKSTLHHILAHVLGDGLVKVSDASAAGIWQKLGYATLPVAMDEVEAEEDNRQSMALLKLARQASSGGLVLRGSADHQATQFVARSCFLMSSILIPPLQPQDRNRIAVLELGDVEGPPPTINPEQLRAIGAGLRRRLVDGWPRLPEILQGYRGALEREGFTARGADLFGTLLACADMMLFDGGDWSSDWAAECALTLTGDGRWESEERDEILMLGHLLTSIIDPYRQGKRAAVGEWLAVAYQPDAGDDDKEANRVLGTYGLKVYYQDGEVYLAIATRHRGLAELFERTHWASRAGATPVWIQAARRLPGAKSGPSIYFGGGTARCVLVPISVALQGQAAAATVDDGATGSGS